MSNSKPKLLLDWATHESAKYACENWHYSGTAPATIAKPVKIGVWEGGAFVGAVIYTHGASSNLGKPYGISGLEVCELQRIALRQHQAAVSKIIAISLRFLKKHCPGLRLIVSFADPFQGHHGGIYQAGGWIYTGMSDPRFAYFDKNGIERHPRNLGVKAGYDKYGVKKYAVGSMTKESRPGKYRYLMPLDDEMRRKIEPLRKPYPKRAVSKENVATGFQPVEGGANPTTALHN